MNRKEPKVRPRATNDPEVVRDDAPAADRAAEGEAVTLTLPLPPSVNHAYRNATINGKARRVQRSGVRLYKAEVKTMALMQRARMLEGDVSLTAMVYFPDKRRRDLSNVIKVMEDSLVGITYRDDSQIHRLELHKFVDRGNPRVEITIEAWASDTWQEEAA